MGLVEEFSITEEMPLKKRLRMTRSNKQRGSLYPVSVSFTLIADIKQSGVVSRNGRPLEAKGALR